MQQLVLEAQAAAAPAQAVVEELKHKLALARSRAQELQEQVVEQQQSIEELRGQLQQVCVAAAARVHVSTRARS